MHKERKCGVGRLIGAVDIDAEFNRCYSSSSCPSNLNFDIHSTLRVGVALTYMVGQKLRYNPTGRPNYYLCGEQRALNLVTTYLSKLLLEPVLTENHRTQHKSHSSQEGIPLWILATHTSSFLPPSLSSSRLCPGSSFRKRQRDQSDVGSCPFFPLLLLISHPTREEYGMAGVW